MVMSFKKKTRAENVCGVREMVAILGWLKKAWEVLKDETAPHTQKSVLGKETINTKVLGWKYDWQGQGNTRRLVQLRQREWKKQRKEIRYVDGSDHL